MKNLGLVASISVVVCSIFILTGHLSVTCRGKDIFPSSSSIAALSGEPRSGRQKRYWLLWCMNYPDCCDIKGKDTCGFACPGCPKKYTPYSKTSTTPKPPNSSGGLAALLAQGGMGAGGRGAPQSGGLAALLAQGGVGAGGGGAPQSGGLAALLAQGGAGGGGASQSGGLATLLAQGGAGGGGASQSGGLATLLAQGGAGGGGVSQSGGLAALLAQGGAGGGGASQSGGLAALLAQGGAGGGGASQSGGLAALLAQGGAGGGGTSQSEGLAALLAQRGIEAGGRGAPQSGGLAALLAQGGAGGEGRGAPQSGGLGGLLGQGGLGGQQPSMGISDQGFSLQKLPATHVTLPVNSKDIYEDGKSYLHPDVHIQVSKANSLDNDKLPSTSDDNKLPTSVSRLPSSSQGLSAPGGPSSQDFSALFAQFGGSNSSSTLGQTPSLELLSSLASQFGGGSSSNVQTLEEQSSPSLSPLLALAAQGGLPKGVEVGPLGIDIFANEELDVTGFGDYEYEDYEDEDGTLIRRRYWSHDLPDHSSTNDLNRVSPETSNPTEYDILSAPLEGTIHTEHHTYNDYLTPVESNYLFGHKHPPPQLPPKKTSSVSLWKRIKSRWDHIRRLWSV